MMSSPTSSPSTAVPRIYQYSRDVSAGRLTACKKTKMACDRFLLDLEKSKRVDYPWEFNEHLAARPIDFMEKFLAPTKGHYGKMELMPWECFAEGNIYGWVDKKTGLRRFREALLLVAKGNGKSTLMAGNATYGASKDGERGAEIYLLANSKEQAGRVMTECQQQIRASPQLSRHFRVLRDGIHFDQTNSIIQHRSRDSEKLDGLNPHLSIFDEIHEYRDYKLINVLSGGTIKRDQPLLLFISTMGTVLDGPLMDYYVLFTDAMEEGVLDPAVADRMFTLIYEQDDVAEINDPSTWGKSNPGLGVVVKLEDLVDKWNRMKNIPQERANFITKNLNISAETSDVSYVDNDLLNRNRRKIDMNMLLGRRCYGGFDLSSRDDFTAAALLFPLDNGDLFVLHHSWVPRAKVEADSEKIDYYGFAMRGLLTICEGEFIDQQQVYEWFREQSKHYQIETIGYDPYNAMTLRRMLEGQGFVCDIVRPGPLTLNDPSKSLKECYAAGQIVSNDDPLLRWYTHNVRLRPDARDKEKNNWMPVKKNRFRKIDGFMAMLTAYVAMLRLNPVGGEAREPSLTVFKFDQNRTRMRF